MKTAKRILFALIACAFLIGSVTLVSANSHYSDVDGTWAETYIDECTYYGIVQGDGERFFPELYITRAELAAMLDRLICYQNQPENTYFDLEDDRWYTESILRLSDAGVMQGNGLGNVRPMAKVTRQEAITMIARAFLIGRADTEAELSYSDADEIAAWAKNYVAGMTEMGYITGIDGKFLPQEYLTRAQAASVFAKLIGDIFDETREYTGKIDGSLVIRAENGITLKDMTVNGSIVISPKVNGEVLLDNVTYTGELVVLCNGNLITFAADKPIIPEEPEVPEDTVQGEDGYIYYTVKSGDTLYKIATTHNTTVSALLALNPTITNENAITLGQNIIIGIWDNGETVPEDPTEGKLKIYLDPGHGFGDPGTLYPQNNPSVFEKDITLALSLLVHDKLVEMGYDVKLSHHSNNMSDNTDTTTGYKMSLGYRYREANSWDADLFLSIHVNSYSDSSVNGFRSFYPTQDSSGETRSKAFQYACERFGKLLNARCAEQVGTRTSSVTNKNYDVLKYTDMVSALFEIGFITNAKDRADMQDPVWLDKMATGIANAIDELAKSTDLEGLKS